MYIKGPVRILWAQDHTASVDSCSLSELWENPGFEFHLQYPKLFEKESYGHFI